MNNKDARIKTEQDRLLEHFKGIPDNKKAVALGLIKNAAFMFVTLEDLQTEINKNGTVEEYQNGKEQRGYKASAALQSYNATVKNYTAVIKQLTAIMPDDIDEQDNIADIMRRLLTDDPAPANVRIIDAG